MKTLGNIVTFRCFQRLFSPDTCPALIFEALRRRLLSPAWQALERPVFGAALAPPKHAWESIGENTRSTNDNI